MKIRDLKYISDYTLYVSFEDGIEGNFKLDDLIEKGIFIVLKNKDLFAKAHSTGYSIAWSDELEIDSDKVYLDISGKSIDEIMNITSAYASN